MMIQLFQKYRWKFYAAGVIVFCFYLFVIVVIPGLQRVYELNSHIQQQEVLIKSVDNWEQKLKNYRQKEEQLTSFFSKLFISTQSADQMSAFVEQLIRNARDAGVTILRLRPEDRIQKDAFSEIPMTLKLKGNYHELARFVNQVEQDNYLVRVSKLKIVNQDEPVSSKLIADIRITFVIISKTEALP